MTTGTAGNPQASQPQRMDVVEVYRPIGRLEAEQGQTREYFVRIEQRFDRQEERTAQRFAQQDARFDRQEERTARRFERQEKRAYRYKDRANRRDERDEKQFGRVTRRMEWCIIIGGFITIVGGFAGLALQNLLSG